MATPVIQRKKKKGYTKDFSQSVPLVIDLSQSRVSLWPFQCLTKYLVMGTLIAIDLMKHLVFTMVNPESIAVFIKLVSLNLVAII